MNKTALIIPFHNRANYLRMCLNSLPKANVDIILINDASTDVDVVPVCEGYTVHNLPENRGIKGVLKYGFEYCFEKGYETVIALDSDTIVTQDFFTRLEWLAGIFPDKVISGINTNNDDNKRNPIISEHKNYILKRYCNGQCILVTRETYEKFIKAALSAAGNWDFNVSKLADSVVCAKPSLVQHIGVVSAMGHHVYGEPDVALDFPKMQLPNVTLFGIDAHDPLGMIRAAKISVRHIDFGDVQIITDHKYFRGRDGYSVFCIKEMYRFVKTDYVLIIHPDGYIQNPWCWNPEWLQYSYIGATWSYKDNMNVGNGGFTLRSRKLLQAIKDFDLPSGCVEDDFICRTKRKHLEQAGFSFAPENVANDFSIEAYGSAVFTDCQGHKANQYTGQFGFHGYQVKGLPIPPLKKVK